MKGKISPLCPRYALIRQMEELKKAGYVAKTGFERKYLTSYFRDSPQTHCIRHGFQCGFILVFTHHLNVIRIVIFSPKYVEQNVTLLHI